MFQVQLTAYGQSLVSDLINIDGIMLLYDYISDLSSVTNVSSYTVTLDEEACGNLKNKIGNVFIRDLSTSEYQVKTILFYKLDGSQKKVVAGYSQEQPLVQKSTSILSIYLTFDFSVFTHGFLFASIQAGYSTAAHNTDGLLHLEDPNIESDDTYSVYSKPQIDTLLQSKQESLEAGNGISLEDNIVKTTGIPFGICDNTSTATAFTVIVPGIYKLEDGVCCLVKNGVITSASGFTLNVNGLGGKPVYSNMAAATRETTIFNVNYTMLFVYDSTRVDGGCWICYRGYYSDANSIGYQIRGNVHTLPTTAKFYRYRLLFTSADGTHFVPSNTSTSTNATALRDVNQTPIDPFGEIVYYSTTAAVEANANPGPTYLWTQYAITFGYSFNRSGAALTLTSFAPVYIKCEPQSNGSAVIDADTPYVQSLPNSADGNIYIFLGIANSETAVELLNNHPVYYHDGTTIRIWHGKDSYSKSEIDTIVSEYVPTSRTVNNKPLSSDVTLTLDDVADGTSRVIPIVNDSTITIKKSTSDTGDSFTTNAASGKTINLGLSTVATSGSYSDLSNTPTIPTVNDAKLTIKKNSSDTGTEFTANASSDVTCNLNLAAVASSGSYSDLSNTPSIPTDTSDLTNGAGFLTTETDPTVPSWAKEQSKPTYTLDEVTDGSTRKLSDYVPTSRKVNNKTLTSDITLTLDDIADGTNRLIPTVNNATLTIQKNGTTVNTFTANASSNVTANITVPTTVAELTDANNYVQTSSLSSLVATAQYNSTDKTIEFYNTAGTKLNTDIDATAFIKDGMVDNVEITGGNLVISFNTDAGKEDIEIPISDIFDANNYYTKTQVDNLIPTVNNATLTIQKNGTTVNTFTANASSPVTANITVPTTVAELSDSSNYVTTDDLAAVATSGDYDDLINKPTIPTVNNATLTIKKTASDTGTTFTANASTDVTCNLDLATVATSGSYSDLSNTPTIPTVNNATLTIQRNGTTVDTFTANSASDVTVNITVPTNTNQLTNGAGFITSSALSTYVEKVDPSTENAIVRFRNVKGDLKDSGVLIDDHNNVILPTGRDTANADKNPHIDIGQSWLGNISSRDTVLYVGTLASNTYTTRYAFQQTAFKPMTDNSYSLGFTSFRWKYLHLSNSIKNGSYTYSLPSSTGTLALTSDIPTNVSQLTNDSGYLTSYTETDPTVPSWAKEQNKPSYTLDEVSDGTTRKLSDYVPTSRTINSKALTADITLTLDDVADGINRVIPTVNNATLTINKGGTDDTSSKTFSANASSDVTINLGLHSVASSGSYNDLTNKPTIPTTTSQLTNNSGFITSSDLPTNHVTTDTVQTITALKTFTNGIDLGTYHTSASQSLSTQITIRDDTTNYQGGIEVTGNFNPATEDEYNLGSSSFPWKNVYANSFVKSGGTSAQFLKADGSVDSNTYLTSSDLPSNHVTTDTAQEITGTKTIAENKLKIGNTLSSEDIDNFVFKRGQEFIVGTQSSSTSLWKGNTTQDSIYEGMCVNYFVPVACTSTAVTLELTLPDGTTTGEIPVRRNAGSTVTNSHIGVGSVVQLTLLLNRTIGSTSYEKVWRMNEWYDSNTNTVGYQLRTNSTVMTVTDTARYYKLYFTSADGEHWVPASVNSTNNATTARAVNQRPINPFGRIVYTSASTSYTAGSNLAATTIWDQYAIVLGYSFNVNGGDLTLTTKTPVYVKCAPQTNGSAIIDSTNPIVQDLPTSADGKIYIFLGIAYDATHIELVINHPVYYHDGNGIKLWTGSIIPSKTSDLANDSGYITSFTETDPTVPSWAKQANKPTYTLDEVSDGTTRKLSDYVRLATTNRENQTINSSITIHPKHNSYNNYREYTFNGTDFSAQTSMELVSWDFESDETVTRNIKLSLQPAVYSEENLEPAYYFRLYTVNSTYSNYEEIFFITKEFDSNSSYYNVNGTAVANYSSVPNTSLVDGRLTTVDYVNAKVKEVYCNATTEVDRDLVPSNYDYRENAPQGTHSDNPKYNGNDVSLGVNQYLEFSDNMRVSVYVLNETYVGSIAFLTAEDASTYAAYPVYFRGQGSAHNASVPAGSILRLTFKQNSFNVDFYDLADFGVEHEPIVRVGQVPHHKILNSYNGALVGIRKDNRKFDHAITVTKSATSSSNTLLNMEPNSPIYVSFMGECFAAHPRVPFGFVTNMEYIYSEGASLTLNNIPFVYVEGGLQVTDLDELQSHIVENTVGGKRYFHVDDAPVYILLSDEYDPLYISIGGLPIDSDGHLIGYLCHGAEYAGLIRLVQNNLPTRASLSARILTTYSGTAKLLAENSYISARDDIYPNINSTTSSNGYTLGSSSYKWRYIYLSSGISNGTYTYSLPSATGTLALTSDLPTNYVTTDTAQTISGNKAFTGTLTGTLTGNADSASKLNLLGNDSDEAYPVVFAESVNTSTSSAISKTLYTDSAYNYSLRYNPNTNICYCTTFNGNLELPSTSTIRFFSNATNFYTKITQGQFSDPNRSIININGFDSSDTVRSSLSIYNGADSNGTSSVSPSLGNWSIGSASDRWKNLYIDNIYIGSNNTSLSNYIADTTVVNATNATNAANVGILGNSTSSNYPLVFTGSVNTSTSSAVNKKLYTDTANSLYYNPSINALSGLFILPKGDATLSGSTWTVSSPSPNTTTSEDPPNGAIIAVYFPSSNTATSPQLKFGSWNAKPIWRTTSTYVGTSPDLSWNDATYVLFIYSSGWRILNFNNNPTSTASGTASIIPSSTNTYNLGSSSYKWNYLYARYVGSSSYPITSIYGRLNSLYGTAVGSLFFFKLIIKNNSSNDITVPRGVSLANTTYFGSTLLQITSYEERVDDTSSSYGTATFTGTFYTMLRFTVAANSSGSTVFVPCLRYS